MVPEKGRKAVVYVCVCYLIVCTLTLMVWIRDGVGSRPSDHYFRSVCNLSVCLCRVFLSRLWSDFDQTWTYVICLCL